MPPADESEAEVENLCVEVGLAECCIDGELERTPVGDADLFSISPNFSFVMPGSFKASAEEVPGKTSG